MAAYALGARVVLVMLMLAGAAESKGTGCAEDGRCPEHGDKGLGMVQRRSLVEKANMEDLIWDDIKDNEVEQGLKCEPACAEGERCIRGKCKARQEKKKCEPACAEGEDCIRGQCKARKEKNTCEPACAEGERCIHGQCKGRKSDDDHDDAPSPAPGPYGRVVTVGDSMFDFTRKTYVSTLAASLDTIVICHAKSGAGMDAIAKQKACSMYSDCTWSVMNDAPASQCGSPEWQVSFEGFLRREIDANRKVIIVGYPTYFKLEADVGKYNQVMDLYAKAASDHDHVWFIDPRQNPIWQTGLDMYAGDKKHPHPERGGKVFAEEVSRVIKEHS